MKYFFGKPSSSFLPISFKVNFPSRPRVSPDTVLTTAFVMPQCQLAHGFLLEGLGLFFLCYVRAVSGSLVICLVLVDWEQLEALSSWCLKVKIGNRLGQSRR